MLFYLTKVTQVVIRMKPQLNYSLFRLVLFHMVLFRAGDDGNEVSACIYPRI